METLREDAEKIIQNALATALPDHAVAAALAERKSVKGKTYLVAFGKAAWQMSEAAAKQLGDSLCEGICITKYNHVKGEIPHVSCYEAGHPVPDENGIQATEKALELVSGLTAEDEVIVLISGGGSALFEAPFVPLEELQSITQQLLACGADITEINTIRKRLSKVKGGRLAELCEPAHVFAIILSDIIGDPLDMIASGPCTADTSTCADALAIIQKYGIQLSDSTLALFRKETPKHLSNVETHVTGSVKQLCKAAVSATKELGYEPVFLTASLDCEARDCGSFLASIARDHAKDGKNLAYICGGETVVHLTGKGLGGRNQEIALSAAYGIRNLANCAVFSVGSDGTDGPTDAAGGYVDTDTCRKLQEMGIRIPAILAQNDSYHALKKADGLIITGPTGTNVNDLTVLLIRGEN